MFPVLATLVRLNVGDKLLSEGPELDVQPPAYLTPLYRWLGGESRSRNLARVSTQLGSMFDAVARTRQLAAASSFATMPATMQEYFTNLETQLRAASTGLANLKETYTGKTADESSSSSASIPGDAAKSQSDAAAAAEEIITLNNLILQLTAVANDIKTLVDSSTSSSFSSSTSTFVSSPAVAPTTETTTDHAATPTKTHAPLTRAKEAPPPSNPSPTKNVQSSVKSQRLTWVDAVKQNAQSSATATAAARSQTASFFCDNINNNVNDDDYLDDLFSDDEFDNDNDNNDAFRSVQNTRKP